MRPHVTVASIVFLGVWLGGLALGVGYLWWWAAGSVQAALYLRKRRLAFARLPVGSRGWPGTVVEVTDDSPNMSDLMKSATTMYAGLMHDGQEMGKRQRIKVAATGNGLVVTKPAVFEAPDVPFDEVGLFDRGSEQGGEPMVRMSRFLVADEWEDGTVHVGEPDPF